MDRAEQNLGAIPGMKGWPLLGNLPQLLPDPLPFLQSGYARFGPVFYARLAGNRKQVFVLGPQGTEQVLQTQAACFSNALGYAELRDLLGPQAVLFHDGDTHRQLRRGLGQAFAGQQLQQHITVMHSLVRQRVQGWSHHHAVHMSEIFELSMQVAVQTLIGMVKDSEFAALRWHFQRMLQGMVGVAPALPGSRKWRGLRSYRWMRDLFVQRLRQSPDAHAGVLASLSYPEFGLSEEQIVDNLIGLLAASYETTASSLAMTLTSLAEATSWQKLVRDELLSQQQPIDVDAVRRCPLTEQVLKESLRLYTPLSFLPRRSLTQVTIGGHTLPANTAVTLAPRFTHHMPSIYAHPERFDPSRFAPDRAEDQAHALAWLPFGRGAHACLGRQFALLEMMVFFSQVLARFDIEATPGRSARRYLPVFQPIGDLNIRLKERSI